MIDFKALQEILNTEISEEQHQQVVDLIDLYEELESRQDDEMSEDDIDSIIKSISDDDILDTYDDDELKVVDDETGETI